MSNTRPEADIARAKLLRKTATEMKDPEAAQKFVDAAVRVERKAGRKVMKVGRTVHRAASTSSSLPAR